MISTLRIGVTPVGANGAASAVASSPVQIQGELIAVYLSFASNVSTNGMHVLVSGMAKGVAKAQTYLSQTGSTASGWFYPRAGVHTSAGVAALYAAAGLPVLDRFPIFDHIAVSVDGMDAITNAVIMDLLYRL